MAMNRIQFQAGLSMRDFQSQYGTDQQCESVLFTSRWPEGWRCSRCGCTRSFVTQNGQARKLWDGKPRLMRLAPIAGFSKQRVKDWALKNLAPTAHVVSDGLHSFSQVLHVGSSHERHVTGGGRQAAKRPEFRWVNTMLGNLKTALSDTYHSFDHVKYGARYLAEFSYRFNRRFDLATMVPRLLRATVTTRPHPLSVLRLYEAGI